MKITTAMIDAAALAISPLQAGKEKNGLAEYYRKIALRALRGALATPDAIAQVGESGLMAGTREPNFPAERMPLKPKQRPVMSGERAS